MGMHATPPPMPLRMHQISKLKTRLWMKAPFLAALLTLAASAVVGHRAETDWTPPTRTEGRAKAGAETREATGPTGTVHGEQDWLDEPIRAGR